MAFSFTPGQIAPQGSATMQPPAGGAPGAAPGAGISLGSAPVESTSPFLFIRDKAAGKPISVLACAQIILVVVAILSVIVCATLYGYSLYLTQKIEKNKEILLAADSSVPDYPYEKMLKLSKRMATLDKVLQRYVSPRAPLKFLENVVENQVYFDKFLLSRDNRSSDFIVSFMAVSTNYKVLIQQLQALNLNEYKKVIQNPKLSGLSDKSSTVKINVSAPVFVQGKLPEEISFIDSTAKNSSSTPKNEP
jgi:hypothetical protein